MTVCRLTGFRVTERMWQASILCLSGIVIILTIWCLTHGITTIFMHLYYFPIVLIAYHYRWKGFGLATLLALVYLGLVMVFDAGQGDVILGAGYRFLIFVGVAAVIAYLSERITVETRSARESTEIQEQYISLAPAIILVLDRNGAITFLNRKGGEILECVPEEVIGESWFNRFLPEQDRDTVQQEFLRLIAGQVEPDRAFENLVLTRRSTRKTIRWYNTVLHDEDGAISGILGFGEDVTEERRAQDTLRNMQQFQESVITNANVWIAVLTRNGTLRIWNDAAEAISGYKTSEVVGKNTVWKRLYPDDEYRKKVTTEIQRIIKRDTYLENFETMIRCADGTTKTIVWNTRGLKDSDGVITSYIAIGRDISAQKAAEARAAESSRFLAAMIDTLPIPVFFKDVSGKYLGCNPPFEEYIGIKRDQIVGKSVYDLSPKDLADKYTAADQQLFDNPAPQRYDTQVQYANGSRHDVIFYKAPFYNKDGTLGGLIGTFLDITDRKQAEVALARSEEKYRAFFTTSRDCIFITTADGRWVDFNDAAVELFEYKSRKDLLETTILHRYADPRDREKHIEYIRKNGYSFEYPVDLKKKDGTIINALITTVTRKDASGTTIGFQGSIRDVTERKIAQDRIDELLRQKEEQLKIINTSPAVAFLWKAEEHWPVETVSENIAQFGYSVEDFISGRVIFSSIIHPSDLGRVSAEVEYNSTHHIEEFGQIYRIFGKDGSVHWIDDFTHIRRDKDGTITHYEGIVLDITERRQAEDALRESEEKFRDIFNNANDGIEIIELLDTGMLGRFTDVNDVACRMLGYTREEMLRLGPLDISTDYFSRLFDEIMQELHTSGHASFETEHRRKDRTIVPVEINTHKITLMGKTVLLSIARDITERKAIEEALRESRQRFSDIISFLPDPTYVIDREGRVLAWNRGLEELSGIPAGAMVGEGDFEYSIWQYGKRRPVLIDLVQNPDRDAARMNYFNIRHEGTSVMAETELTLPSGKKVALSHVASPLFDEKGMVTGAIESLRDITHIRETEAELARLNENLETIVRERTRALQEEVAQRQRAEKNVQAALDYTRSVIEANPDLMAILDTEGKILDVNTVGETLTGIPKDQLIGTPYFSYLEDDGMLYTAFSRHLETGWTEKVIRIYRTDGHLTPLSVHATLIKGTGTTPDRIIVAAHDITRQKQDEDAIRASLDEKVLLLREIHHRVKNNLQIIISLTNLQMRTLENPEMKQILAETRNRVRAMSLVHEKLYMSENLSSIDLADYTKYLATQLFSFYGVDYLRVALKTDIEKVPLDIDTAIPLGLVLNELISNALKHAFHDGRNGTLSISGHIDRDLMTVIVEDDGVGMPSGFDWKNSESLGLRLVNSLVDQLEGTIEKGTGEGTMFIITFHRKSNRESNA